MLAEENKAAKLEAAAAEAAIEAAKVAEAAKDLDPVVEVDGAEAKGDAPGKSGKKKTKKDEGKGKGKAEGEAEEAGGSGEQGDGGEDGGGGGGYVEFLPVEWFNQVRPVRVVGGVRRVFLVWPRGKPCTTQDDTVYRCACHVVKDGCRLLL